MMKTKNFTLNDDGSIEFKDNWDDEEQAKLAAEVAANADVPVEGAVKPVPRDKPVITETI